MMGCLDDGALRAYLDGELPEPKVYRAAAHLEACTACRARLQRVEATAARVDAWLNALEADGAPAYAAAPPLPARAGWGRGWAVAALAGALAAAIVLGVVMSWPRPATVAHQAAMAPHPDLRALVPVAAPPPNALPAATRRAVVRRQRTNAPQPPQPRLDDFMPLDDADPIQMGLVVRVMVPVSTASRPGDTQEIAADVLVGEDGRARAIRFVE